MSGQKWRITITALLIVVGILMFWDTFTLWTMSDEEKVQMQADDPAGLLALQQSAIRLGLDLQGGIHVVLRVQKEKLSPAEREGAVDRAIQVIRTRIDGLGVAEPNIQAQGDEWIIVDLPGYTDTERAEELIGQTALLQFKMLESYESASLLLTKIDSVVHAHEVALAKLESGTDDDAADGTTDETVAEETADTETDAAADLLAELTGDTTAATGDDTLDFSFDEDLSLDDDDRPVTSRLEPALFNNTNNTNWPGYAIDKRDKPIVERWLNLEAVKSLLPIDVQFAWSTRSEIRQNREVYYLYLLKRKEQFRGEFLTGIGLGRGQYGDFTVNFKIISKYTGAFARLTGSNIDKPMAIVIDDKVESAAFIRSKIRNSGEITMGGQATLDEAKNLMIVLEAGALPAPVEIIEKNVVGASLGADSIQKGFMASLAGLMLVLLYIGVYYRLSGVIANIGLLFNIFFLLAVMAALGATLTMPGIAGIILTIGISVDANILIFERIREELRTGKTVRASIDAGYQRAFVAIFDSHVTTLITAGALFIFGSGPIKGFAVTLFWGVTISLYTAYVITKAIFDIRKGYQSLSI